MAERTNQYFSLDLSSSLTANSRVLISIMLAELLKEKCKAETEEKAEVKESREMKSEEEVKELNKMKITGIERKLIKKLREKKNKDKLISYDGSFFIKSENLINPFGIILDALSKEDIENIQSMLIRTKAMKDTLKLFDPQPKPKREGEQER